MSSTIDGKPTMTPGEFWQPWEDHARSFSDAIDFIQAVHQKGKRFVWRGQVDASWPLHSSLYRRLAWTKGTDLEESDLYQEEGSILTAVNRWGLHVGERGHLPILPQLALLQHYGVPTRLIDVTFNALIGLWFAVEEKWENGKTKNEDTAGRLFAIDVTDRLINENHEKRSWEQLHYRPWSPTKTKDFDGRTAFAWRPPSLDPRIAAQNGGFIFGLVPTAGTSKKPMQWSKNTQPLNGAWQIEEVRRCVSIPIKVNKLARIGRPPASAMYTLNISAHAKKEIRKVLQELYGYGHSTIYPDYTGFAHFGTPHIKSYPSK
jgi:hypothetical protein